MDSDLIREEVGRTAARIDATLRLLKERGARTKYVAITGIMVFAAVTVALATAAVVSRQLRRRRSARTGTGPRLSRTADWPSTFRSVRVGRGGSRTRTTA